jgi:hypothetical protein
VSHGAGSRGRRAAHERHARSPTRRGARPGARGVERRGAERAAQRPSNCKRRAQAAGDAPPRAHARGGGAGRGGARRGGAGLGGTDRSGGADKRRGSTDWGARSRGAAGGAPAPVTGTNTEVLCARAPHAPPAPLSPLTPPPPPGPRAAPTSQPPALVLVPVGLRNRAPRTHTHTRPPPERLLQRAGYASVFAREGPKKKKKKKLFVFFFSPEWVQEARPGKPSPFCADRGMGAQPCCPLNANAVPCAETGRVVLKYFHLSRCIWFFFFLPLPQRTAEHPEMQKVFLRCKCSSLLSRN